MFDWFTFTTKGNNAHIKRMTLQSLQYSVSSTAHKSHTVNLSVNDRYMQKLRKFQIIQISVYTVWLCDCILSVWIAALTASELGQTSHSM